MTPFISICIPAYRRIKYLRRLLDSINEQTYANYEVIITDDSPEDEIGDLVKEYPQLKNVRYYKNTVSLGTPENWNESIRKAKGEWIKLMHDDDWFADRNSLKYFAEAAMKNSTTSFFFSAYNNYNEKKKSVDTVYLSSLNENRLQRNSLYLFRKNYIGNPSCTFIKREVHLQYDARYKFVVDFEYYIRLLKVLNGQFIYINDPLVNIGVNDTQVTTYTFRVGTVEIDENHTMLESMGIDILKYLITYDYFWRSYRNLGINDIKKIYELGYKKPIHRISKSMIYWQNNIPDPLLQCGPFSKIFMWLHYIIHFHLLKTPL